MHKSPADILEEVWTASNDWIELPDPSYIGGTKSISIAATPIGEGVWINEDDTDRARAKIAACAPEALKLLLHLNKVMEYELCPYCSDAPHAQSCPVLILLKKAGLK